MAAAAYAALVSLMNILDRHTRIPLPIPEKQIQSLNEKVSFLVDFLESVSHGTSKEDEYLEMRIADVVYEAEDIIENHVVDERILSSKGWKKLFRKYKKGPTSSLSAGIEKVLDGMDLIAAEVKLKQMKGVEDLRPRSQEMMMDHSSRSLPVGKDTMVGFEDERKELMERLTGGDSGLQIIPIVGMGGSGKTTLAKNVYEDPYVVNHFDICAWVSMHHNNDPTKILLQLLRVMRIGSIKDTNVVDDGELGMRLHRYLFGRRYLIVIDDLWSMETWYSIRRFIPDSNIGSRIIVTTRSFEAASAPLQMRLLDEMSSWHLLREQVYGSKVCPLQLERFGRNIARNCEGLPLCIVVIGGLLARSEKTKEYWEYVAKVTGEAEGYSREIVSLSYQSLPIQLKPCFLYMAVFPEVQEIHATVLINLWVAEGFLKPNSSKDLEVVGEEYLNELVRRNLISVRKRGSDGKVKLCYLHDAVRDLCSRESYRQKFLFTMDMDMNSYDFQQGISNNRRISIHGSSARVGDLTQALKAMKPRYTARSLTCDSDGVLPLKSFRLLRVFNATDESAYVRYQREEYVVHDVLQLVNSRYIAFRAAKGSFLPSSLSLLGNLQTLVIEENLVVAPQEIWGMIELRHLECRGGLHLRDPPSLGRRDNAMLKNLRTLMRIENFRFGIEVVKSIPSIKKLKISYRNASGGFGEFCLGNLCHLKTLESLSFSTNRRNLPKNLDFPISLKKLTLRGCGFQWEAMRKIGDLPHLEVLKLGPDSFRGPTWEPVEGQFLRLRFLLVDKCADLVEWRVENTHFPCLEHLVLRSLPNLVEIPEDVGFMLTLQSIQLEFCSDSTVKSAMRIPEKLESGLQVRVYRKYDNKVIILAGNSVPVESEQVEEMSAPLDEIRVVKRGELTVVRGKVGNPSPVEQVKHEVHCSDVPEESIDLGQSIQTRIPTDTSRSSQEADHNSTTLNKIIATENLSPLEQINREARCSDEPEGSKNLGQSILTPISNDSSHSTQQLDHCSTTLAESITITMSATHKLHTYVDLELRIFHAPLKEVQHPSWDFNHLDLGSANNAMLFLVKKKLLDQNFDQPNCPLSTQYAIHQLNGVVPPKYLINRSFGGSTKLLTTEEWHTACVVSLTEMGRLALPKEPDCPNLVVLLLQSKHRWFDIPLSFFHLMRGLKFLDLSGMKIMKLPSSLFSCTELQVLLLRNCVYLEDLPLEIGNLQNMEVLDLSGTELRNLPNQVGELKCLKDLQLSLYGPDDDSEYVQLTSELVSGNILSKLQELHALSIGVHPEDYRWRKIVANIIKEISELENLRHLQFYFPEITNLVSFIDQSSSWSSNTLKSFKFVVGRDVKRIVHRVPNEVELKYNQRARCLRFVNGNDLPQVVIDVLRRTTAFSFDHHLTAHSLSQFGISNLKGLNFCVLRECPNLEVIIDDEEINDALLPSLEYLEIHYLWKLRHIWKLSQMPSGSFRALKCLTVCSCPVLQFILPLSMRICLSNLEELFVEDCEAVTKIFDGETETVENHVNVFPQLRKVELRYLPRLVSLGVGLCLTEEKISVHGCPNLILNVNPRKSRGLLCGCFS